MDKKPISFGFSKISKKPDKKPLQSKTVELIECLEGKSIKIKDSVEEVKAPLIIPIRESSKNLINRIKEAREKNVIKTEIKQEEIEKPDSELTIDELAARELIREAQNRDKIETTTKILELPAVQQNDRFVADGEPEPTLEDYENIPISDYGMAMLRGMGWKEGMAIGKDPTKTVPLVDPELRPKGLGLGADKLISMNKPEKIVDKDGKELMLIKGAYGKVIAGNHKGHYCQIQGLDDQSGRIIVKTALTNEILSLDEFLLIPVTKDEYTIGSKVINNVKYEQYKEEADEKLKNFHRNHDESNGSQIKTETDSDSAVSSDGTKRKSCKNKKHKSRRHRSRSNEKHDHSHKKSKKKKTKSRYRSKSRDRDDYNHRHNRRK